MRRRRDANKEPLSALASTWIVMAATMLSRMLGFLRIAVIGAIFGASGAADVLNLVFNIPNNLRKLLAEGALSSAFVPALTRAHVEDPSRNASRDTVRRLLGLQLIILLPVLLVSVLFSGAITGTILDFRDSEKQALAAVLFRWMIHYLLLISVAAVIMGTLNSEREFRISSIAPLWFSFSVIGSVLLFHRSLGVFAMVVGVLIGGLGQVALQVPRFRALGYRMRPRFDFREPRFQAIVRRWLPVVSTSSVFAINQQVALYFASGLVDGSGSALTNALVFWQLPFGIFGASITTVLFPEMSRYAAEGPEARSRLGDTLYAGLQGLALLLIPSAVGLAVLGQPIIAVALERGAFSSVATTRAARVLAGYSLGLFSVGAFTFAQRFFYACGDFRTPLRVALIVMVLDVGLSLWLKETRLAVAGLAVANGIAFTVGLALFARGIASHLGELRVRVMLVAFARAAIASAAAVLVVALVRYLIHGTLSVAWWSGGSSWRAFGLLLAETLPALGALVLAYRLLGVRPRSLLKPEIGSRM